MIVIKHWHKRAGKFGTSKYNYMGVFLLGFIPLYIKRSDWYVED